MKILIAIAIIAMIALVGCDLDQSVEVRYTVTATESIRSVTISAGGTVQFTDVAPPWSYSFTATEGDFVYVSAMGYGVVVVEIYRNGKLYRSARSEGRPVIARVSGRA